MSAVVLALMVAASTGKPPTGAFGPGEQITYKVTWLGLPAGMAEVTVGAEVPERAGTLPIVTKGQSDLVIYPIRDKIISWWDPAAGRSRGLEMYQDENHKRRRLRIDFDGDDGKARVLRQVEGEPAQKSEIEVPAGAVDVATAVFFLRAARLADGDELSMPIFTGTKVFKGIARVASRGPVDTALGPVNAVRVTLRTEFSGKLSARELRMWFSDDEAHIPVRMEADFSLGPVVVEWTDYKAGRPLDPSTMAQGR
ncbi:MAG TPA: DUF3108 domain-containing protein [Myxococcaceae bacterium]|nr:DUF3108 domain-containing protein [Myxococcaceae bacterium]